MCVKKARLHFMFLPVQMDALMKKTGSGWFSLVALLRNLTRKLFSVGVSSLCFVVSISQLLNHSLRFLN